MLNTLTAHASGITALYTVPTTHLVDIPAGAGHHDHSCGDARKIRSPRIRQVAAQHHSPESKLKRVHVATG